MRNLEKLLGKLDQKLGELEHTVSCWGLGVDLAFAGGLKENGPKGYALPEFFDADLLFPGGEENHGYLTYLRGQAEEFMKARDWMPEVFEIWEDGNCLGRYPDPDLALVAVKNFDLSWEGLVLLGVDFSGRVCLVAQGWELEELADTWPEDRDDLLRKGRAILSAARERAGLFTGSR